MLRDLIPRMGNGHASIKWQPQLPHFATDPLPLLGKGEAYDGRSDNAVGWALQVAE